MSQVKNVLEFISTYGTEHVKLEKTGHELIFSILYPFNNINTDELDKLKKMFEAKEISVREESDRKWWLRIVYDANTVK